MPNSENIKKLELVAEDINNAQAIWVVDYRGLTVKESQNLRRQITAAGGQMKIYKNTITKIALANAELPTLDDVLEGPSAFVFCGEHYVEVAKVLKDFAKECDNKLVTKGGILEGKALDADQVKAIADLPPREVLIAKLLGTLQNPMSGLVRVLNGPATQFVRTLAAVADSKSAA